MAKQRTDRLNSLLREVIAEVIRKRVRNPKIPELLSVTRVDITKDLRHAKVYISLVDSTYDSKAALRALQSASGFISTIASKKVVIRYFPSLSFRLDDTVDKQMRIHELLTDINEEQENRHVSHDDTEDNA